MPSNNSEYQKTYYKKWYKENKAKVILQNGERRKQYRKQFRELKEGKPCTDCGIIYPYYVMDWDHLGSKELEVSILVRRGAWKVAREELKNCELVCANCHRIRTWNRKQHLAPPSLET